MAVLTRSNAGRGKGLGQAVIAFMEATPPPMPAYTASTATEESFLSQKYMGIPLWGIVALALGTFVGIPLLRKKKSSRRR